MPEGSENVNIGEPIAIVVENKEDIPAFANATKESIEGTPAPEAAAPTPAATPAPATPAPEAAAPAPAATPATPAVEVTSSSGRVFISPLAKTILKNSGASVDLSTIKGTGPQGRIVAADILAVVANKTPVAAASAPVAAASTTATPSSGVNYEDVAVTPMRKIISTRLTESKQTIPHYYVNQTCYVDDLLKVRVMTVV